MIIYLYIKTHKKTGLKYLGKTTRKDYHSYPGSGKRWIRHLKKHGFDYTTTILLATTCEQELKETGIFFSKFFNVVKNTEWANLVEESGSGGRTIEHVNIEYRNKRLKAALNTKEAKERRSEIQKARVENGTHHFTSTDFIKKTAENSRKRVSNGTHNFLGENNPSHERIKNGTHHFLDKEKHKEMARKGAETKKRNGTSFSSTSEGKQMMSNLQQKRVKKGTHNFLGKNNPCHERIESGTHNFVGKISCRTKTGECVQISKDLYYSQVGPCENWDYVVVRSKEGIKRKELLTKY